MEEFDDDDDFSDLYADVEVQASSAISALHGLTGMLSAKDEIFSNAIRHLPREEAEILENATGGFSKIEIAVGEGGSYGNATGVEEGEIETDDDYGSGSESEDDLNVVLSEGVDVKKQKLVDNIDDYIKNGVDFGVRNGSKYAGEEIEEGDIKVGEGVNGKKKHFTSGDCYSQRKEPTKDTPSSKEETFDHTISSSEDNMPSLGSDNEGRRKFASERGSRHRRSSDPSSLDLDKKGTVQIYDSEEENHFAPSGCDSDGVVEVRDTSDDMDRKNAGHRSNNGLSCSPCPCAAVTNGNRVKCHEHSKNPTISSNRKFQKLVICDYDTSKVSKSRVEPNTKDGRYYERDKVPRGKSYKRPKRPLVSLDQELHEFVSSDYRPFKDSKRHGVESNTADGTFCKTDRGSIRNELKPKRRSNNMSNSKPHLNHEDAYDGIGIKGIYDMQSFGYQAGRHDNYTRNEEQSFLKKKRTKVVDYENLEDDWYYKERRNMAQNVNTPNFEVSRKLISRYSSYAVNGRGTQFSEERDEMQFRSKAKKLDSAPFYEYNSGLVEGKGRRYMLNTERNRDHLDHRYDQNISQDRRESGRYGNHNTISDSSQRCLEYYHTGDHFARRKYNLQSALTLNTSESFPDCHYQESFIRSRYHGQPERLRLNQGDYRSMQQSDTMFFTEGSSDQFEIISRRRPDKRYATDYVAEVLNEREVDGCRYKLLGECHYCSGFDQRSNLIHPVSRVHMLPRYQDPCFVHEGEKCTMLSSRRTSEAANAIHYGRYGFSNWNNDQEPGKYLDNNFSDHQKSEFLDTEEGQIIDEEISEEPFDCEIESKHVTQVNGNKVVELDDQTIQEIKTKMERRRERFKEPITLNMDSGKFSRQLPDMDVETAEGKVLRPARKRRWLGSQLGATRHTSLMDEVRKK